MTLSLPAVSARRRAPAYGRLIAFGGRPWGGGCWPVRVFEATQEVRCCRCGEPIRREHPFTLVPVAPGSEADGPACRDCARWRE